MDDDKPRSCIEDHVFLSPTVFDGHDYCGMSGFLKVYFDFGYYFCYIPFRLVKNPGNGFRLQTNRIQQVACMVTQLMVIFRFISRFRKLSLDGIGQKSIVYFDLFGNVMSVVYHLVFINLLWRKQKQFMDILTYVDTSPSLPKRNKNCYRLAISICALYAAVAILHPIVGHGLFHSSSWSLNLLTTCYIEEAKSVYFLNGLTRIEKCETLIANGSVVLSHISIAPITDILLGTSFFVMHLYRNFAALYIDLLILMCTLTLWYPVTAFAQYLKSNPLDINGTLDKYTSLKLLSSKISTTIGSLLVAYFVEGIMYYSTHLDNVIVVNDWFEKFRVSIFLVTLSTILTISGKTCKKVQESMQDWINYEDNSARIPQHKLVIMLHELDQHAVGMSGNGLFTISFVLVTNMCSVVVTYFIITLDFKSIE